MCHHGRIEVLATGWVEQRLKERGDGVPGEDEIADQPGRADQEGRRDQEQAWNEVRPRTTSREEPERDEKRPHDEGALDLHQDANPREHPCAARQRIRLDGRPFDQCDRGEKRVEREGEVVVGPAQLALEQRIREQNRGREHPGRSGKAPCGEVDRGEEENAELEVQQGRERGASQEQSGNVEHLHEEGIGREVRKRRHDDAVLEEIPLRNREVVRQGVPPRLG